MITTFKTDKLVVGVLMSATTWLTAQATGAEPGTAPAPYSAESATALPQVPNTMEAAQSPQISRAATKPPAGTIIYAINAERGSHGATAAKARWRPVSTLPSADGEPATAIDVPPTQIPAMIATAPIPTRRPANKLPVDKLPVDKLPEESTAARDRMLLAKLDADLRRTQGRLNRADAKLSDGQRQLSSFTNALQQAMLEAGPDARGLHPFVRVAKSYAGTPYVWGLASKRGFDCSGFIIRVMRDLGYPPLPHSAAIQFNYGQAVASPLLKPGDLVFFKNTYKRGVSHVGIYLGKRRFIHAAGTGQGTIVSSLDEPKWRPGLSGSKYAGARRLIPSRG